MPDAPRVVIGGSEDQHVVITVLGRMHGSNDYWDGNWLVTPIEVAAGGLRAAVGAALRAEELASFRRALAWVDQQVSGEAVLESMEDWLTLRVTVARTGQVTVTGRVSDRPGVAELTFVLDGLDVTYLPAIIDQLSEVERAYPVVGKP